MEDQVYADSAKCPYVVGNIVKLKLKPVHSQQQEVTAKITKIFEPFTFSCAMVVNLIHSTSLLALNNHQVVLKIFDRRFATQFRRDEHASLHTTTDIERQYHQFVRDGGAANFIANYDASDDEEEYEWDDPHNEAYLQYGMQHFYEAEIEAYNILKDVQGQDIPCLFASFTLPSLFSPGNQLCDIPGVILQHIDGFPLGDISLHAPKEKWQSVCDDAISIVHMMGDRGILNKDVKTRSFIVREESEGSFNVFMIDFAMCNFRQQYDDETEWRKDKAIQDEEGAVGYVMEDSLKGGYTYHRSLLYTKLDREFKAE